MVNAELSRSKPATEAGNVQALDGPRGQPIEEGKKEEEKEEEENEEEERKSEIGNQINKSKNKRLRRKERKNRSLTLKLLGNNVDGLKNKLESLEHLIISENPSVFFFQETKMGRAGKIKTPSSRKYTWYELNRTKEAEKGEKGGGVAIGVLNELHPSWISEGDDDAEALTIEIWVEGFPLRLVCGYGPQEYDNKERKESFWKYLNNETQKASTDGAGLILQMDGNLWAGKGIIDSDRKKQNQNGKFFNPFCYRTLI